MLLCCLAACACVTNREARGSRLACTGAWCAKFGGVTAPCTDDAYARDGVLAVALTVSVNGNTSDASANAVPWLYQGLPPALQYSLPAGGPAAGGTLVDVVGLGLLDFGGVVCLFTQSEGGGAIAVPAVLAGGVDIVARDGAPLTTRVRVYDARATPEVDRQSARSIRCRSPPLRVVNESDGGEEPLGQPLPPGTTLNVPSVSKATLSLSLDGGRHYTNGRAATVDYWYVTPVPSAVEPSGGPRAGGTRITLHGVGFFALYDRALSPTTDTIGASCHFDGHATLVAGTIEYFHGIAKVLCYTPAWLPPSEPNGGEERATNSTTNGTASDRRAGSRLEGVAVRVTVNGGMPSTSDPSVAFHYFGPDALVVSSIYPHGGPAAGGTAVTIRGASDGISFAAVGGAFCSFGGTLPPVEGIMDEPQPATTAQNISGGVARFGAIVCLSPPHFALRATPSSRECMQRVGWRLEQPSCGSSEEVALEVSLSGGETSEFSTSGLTFGYYAYLANPGSGNMVTPLPPPPPPSSPPCPPVPSPPPPTPIQCDQCDAGAVCARCLVLVPATECPDDADLPPCNTAVIEALCEGDGECGTNPEANNCHPGAFDVYRRVSCHPVYPAPGE